MYGFRSVEEPKEAKQVLYNLLLGRRLLGSGLVDATTAAFIAGLKPHHFLDIVRRLESGPRSQVPSALACVASREQRFLISFCAPAQITVLSLLYRSDIRVVLCPSQYEEDMELLMDLTLVRMYATEYGNHYRLNLSRGEAGSRGVDFPLRSTGEVLSWV